MKKIPFKTLAPYLAAIVIFLVISLIYFSPLLEGKKIQQSDIIHFQGMSKEIADYRSKTGEEPLWTNSMFSGMPAYQISVRYTSNLIGYFDKVFTLGLPHPANLLFLYFIGFFILLLVLGVNPWLAIAGAIGYAFSSYFFIIIGAGHNSKAHAIGYIAPLLAGIILTFRKKYVLGGILTALFLSLELKVNHPQITYYFMILAFLLGLAELIQSVRQKYFPSFLKAIGIISIAVVFAVLTNITNLWATYEYSKYTIRGQSELTTDKENKTTGLDKDYATQWSYGIGETMTLLIPNFYGGSSNEKLGQGSAVVKALRENNVPEQTIEQFTSQEVPFLYWGDQPFTSGPVYVGAIIVFLFVLGLIIIKGPIKWALLAATIISILLSWGHNFMSLTDFFFAYVPGYNKFRAVSMILVIAEIAIPILGIMALKEVFDAKNDPKMRFKDIIIAFAITGGLALIFALFPGIFLGFTGSGDGSMAKQFPDWFMQALRDDRQSMVRLDALRSFIFILLTAAVLWAVLFGKVKKHYAYFALIVLFLVDMFPVNKRYLNNDSFTTSSKVSNPYVPTQADEQILQDKDPDFRVLNLTVNTFNDASTSYFHKSIGGYHGAKLRRYQELIENQISNNNMAVLNMLNTKYFIIPDENKNPVVQRNPSALGHAWFVNACKLVDNADAEMNAITRFNPRDTAIIDKRFANELKSFAGGRDTLDFIRLDEYRPNYLEYSYKAKNNTLAVFSEIYYPKGWNAYIDGKPELHFRANYVLRAMVVPAGDHKVIFKFEPRVYFIGEKIALISSVILLLLLVVFGFMEVRKALLPKE